MSGTGVVERLRTRGLRLLVVSPLALGRAVSALALLYAAVVLNPRFIRRIHLGLWLPDVHPAEPGLGVALGLVLLGLARGLRRGKRRAWRAATGLVLLELVVQLHLRHWLVAATSLLVAVALWGSRAEFVGRPDPSTRGRVLRVGLGSVGASLLLGVAAVSLAADETGRVLTIGQRLTFTVQGMLGIPTPVTDPQGRLPDLVYYLLLSLGVLCVLWTGWLALRSASATPQREAEEEQALRAALRRGNEPDSLDYFALRDDRALVWSPAGGACISYRVIGSTALAAGDPIGVRAQWPDAIRAFLDQAAANGWAPAMVAASAAGAEAWLRHGRINVLEFGDEAVVHTADFSLEGREMRNVRHAVTRAQRAGYEVVIRRGSDIGAEEAALLRDLVDLWRTGPIERGFSMSLGRFDLARDPDVVVALAVRDGQPEALLGFVPWGRDGLSLDVMRRSPGSDSGINELLIATVCQRAAEVGVTRVSLNFAAFRDAIERSERIGAGPLTRAWGRLLKAVSRWSQADSLYRFNAKFGPEWRPRFVGYDSAAGLPRVAIAYLEAESLLGIPRPFTRRQRA